MCRAWTATSATSSVLVEPLAVARQIGVSLTRRLVACAVFSIASLMRSCSLRVSTSHCNSWQMSVTDFALGTNARPTQIAGDTAFVVCTEKTACGLRTLVKKLHHFLELAGNDLITMSNHWISFRYHVCPWIAIHNRGRCTTLRCSPVAGTLMYSTFDENTTAR